MNTITIENVKYVKINRMVFGELEEVADVRITGDHIQLCRAGNKFAPLDVKFLDNVTCFIAADGKSYALVKNIIEGKPVFRCHDIVPTCSSVASVHHDSAEEPVFNSAFLGDWLNSGFVVKLSDADLMFVLHNGHIASAAHINSICGVREVSSDDAKQVEHESEFYRTRIDGCDIYLHEDEIRNVLSYLVVHEISRSDDKKLAVFGHAKGARILNVAMTRGADTIDIANIFDIKEATFAFAPSILPSSVCPNPQYLIGRYSYPADADRILVRDPWKNIVHEFTAEYVRKTYRAFDIHVKYFNASVVPLGAIVTNTYLAKDNRWIRAAKSMNVAANASADVLITNAVKYLSSYAVTMTGRGGGRVYGNSQNANGAAASAFYPPIGAYANPAPHFGFAATMAHPPAPPPGLPKTGLPFDTPADLITREAVMKGLDKGADNDLKLEFTPNLKPIAGMVGGPLGGYGPYHPHNELDKPVEKSTSRNHKEVYTAFDTRADLINMEAVIRLEFAPNPEDRNTVIATSSDSTIGMQRIIPFDYYTAMMQYEVVFGVNSIEELAPDAAHPSSRAVEVESASVRSGEITYTFRMRSDDRNRVDIFISNEQPPTDHIGSISTALFNAMLRAQCVPTTNISAAMCVIEMIKK